MRTIENFMILDQGAFVNLKFDSLNGESVEITTTARTPDPSVKVNST